MITVTPKSVYLGPNPHSRSPVVVADLAIDEEMPGRSAAAIDALKAIGAKWYAGEADARCADDAERLVDFILSWSISALTYFLGYLQDYGFRRTGPGSFVVWLGFHQPKISYAALAIAAEQCVAAANGHADPRQIAEQLSRLWSACRTGHPGPQTRIIMEAAAARDIPCMGAWGVSQYWQFGWGAKSETIFLSASNADGFVSANIVANKASTKRMIRSLGFPVPDDVLVNSLEGLPAAAEEIGFPCVVKPIDQLGGNGVGIGIKDLDDARSAFEHARKFSSAPIMLERLVPGSDHRLMLVGGRLIGAFRRDPPSVTGDGVRTIRDLVDELNADRVLPGAGLLARPVAVQLNEEAMLTLARQGASPDSVPPAGEEIRLRSTANVETGGTSTDVTARLHPDIRLAAEGLAQTLDINMGGFDYITTDIGSSWRDVPGAFIELNLTPGLYVPTLAGWPAAAVGDLALGSVPGRIPVDCIVADDDVVARIEAHLTGLEREETAGWASHDMAQLGPVPLLVRPHHQWAGVISLLSNRMVHKALLVVSSQRMRQDGFPVDRADRIWNCDGRLPPEWQEVLRSISPEPVWQGEWSECAKLLAAEG